MSTKKAISKVLKRVLFSSLVLGIISIPGTIYASSGTDVKLTNTETEKVIQYNLNEANIRIAAAPTTYILYDENCLTNTEWRSGGWGDPNSVTNVVLNDQFNYYRFSIVKKSGKWTNGGYLRFVRISDNKVMWEVKQDYSRDFYYHDKPTKLIQEGDYRLTYGYGKPNENKNWMQYYSKIIRVTRANK
ncbi:hypothetical protein K413DRAFT_3053 [Clostridium sp. ASBs410]|nr:hypothetical protein K413DRAFT_3053 [Clostridium sp. ASBs410]